MTPQQGKTLARLFIAVGLLFAWLGYLGWVEYAGAMQGGHSLITDVMRLAWTEEPWAFWLSGVSVAFILGGLSMHFFGAGQATYRQIREDSRVDGRS